MKVTYDKNAQDAVWIIFIENQKDVTSYGFGNIGSEITIGITASGKIANLEILNALHYLNLDVLQRNPIFINSNIPNVSNNIQVFFDKKNDTIKIFFLSEGGYKPTHIQADEHPYIEMAFIKDRIYSLIIKQASKHIDVNILKQIIFEKL